MYPHTRQSRPAPTRSAAVGTSGGPSQNRTSGRPWGSEQDPTGHLAPAKRLARAKRPGRGGQGGRRPETSGNVDMARTVEIAGRERGEPPPGPTQPERGFGGNGAQAMLEGGPLASPAACAYAPFQI